MKRFSRFFVLGVFCTSVVQAEGNCLQTVTTVFSESHSVSLSKLELSPEHLKANLLLAERKGGYLHPEIPGVDKMSLVPGQAWVDVKPSHQLSVGLTDPVIEHARSLKAFDDFKPLSDARPRTLSSESRDMLIREADLAARKGGPIAQLQTYIKGAYDFGPELKLPKDDPVKSQLVKPRWRLASDDAVLASAFDYTENMWPELVKETPHEGTGGSLLASPYPITVPAGRFQEAYYWDTYFGVRGLLATGRLDLAQMQTENLLSYVQRFGFVPNGGRDYYLSRTQPPFLSSLVREVYEASLRAQPERAPELKRWLEQRAYPLLKSDYDFWMKGPRYDRKTGLNRHWDEVNLPRPERHAADDEEALGASYRDVRAAAESGLDFTETLGSEASQVAGVLLNSIMYKTESDLEWAARSLGLNSDAVKFATAAKDRKRAMNRYLWDPHDGRFENFNLKTRERIKALSADTYAPLFAKLATPRQAARVRNVGISRLEQGGGIMSSELTSSTHQWDGHNGWAPHQVFAIEGLRNYGYVRDSKRIADKWVRMIADVHARTGKMYERYDVAARSKPLVDETKYPPQEGFLWTNASYSWALRDVLGYQLAPLASRRF